MRLLYNLLLHILLPFLPLRLLWRGLKEPIYLKNWGHRFGFFSSTSRGVSPLIWVHAVSLGETRAAQPLVNALRAQYPGYEFLITHMTATGRQAAEDLYGDFAQLAFLPYDFPWAMESFLRHCRPRIGLIMETELWPNLLLSAEKQGIALALVNARMSAKSAAGYQRFGRFARSAIATLDLVSAQSEADARHLLELGAPRVEVTGNLKFDAPSGDPSKENPFVEWFKGREVLLLASTREGEEALILDALARCRFSDEVLFVLVPRHPQRFDDVAQLLRQRGISYSRRTERPPKPQDRFFLGDSMGEMSSYYAACHVAFVGGSLLPYGSQNLIEACAQGAPVLIGPSTFNFAQAAELAIEAGAAVRVDDADMLLKAAQALLNDPVRQAAMKEAGLAFCAAHRGATARTVALIEQLLPR